MALFQLNLVFPFSGREHLGLVECCFMGQMSSCYLTIWASGEFPILMAWPQLLHLFFVRSWAPGVASFYTVSLSNTSKLLCLILQSVKFRLVCLWRFDRNSVTEVVAGAFTCRYTEVWWYGGSVCTEHSFWQVVFLLIEELSVCLCSSFVLQDSCSHVDKHNVVSEIALNVTVSGEVHSLVLISAACLVQNYILWA